MALRSNQRVVVSILLVSFIILLTTAYGRHRIQARPPPPQHQTPVIPADKIIVMAKMERENTDWVAEKLSDWQNAIYTVDSSTATLRTPLNKGREAMAYLTYLIDNYANLPSIIAFLHPHQGGSILRYWSAWHTDAEKWSNVASLSNLRLDTVGKEGYVNLRCAWNPGCKPAHRHNAHVTPQIWTEIFGGNVSDVPSEVGAACCAQFAVSRQQVHKRTREEYVQMREWLTRTELDDGKSGRVMEFLWHIIFGQEAVQ
ncbi:MAG: hypothetical protein M1817_006705 [Caeruleum heppii]|nr:MAG: hypothetical protein M1817_006705 [Caeruleum heppii]